MDTKNNVWKGLLYKEEHLTCKNYLTGDSAIFEEVRLKAEKLFIGENIGRSTLVFLLFGDINISTKKLVNCLITAGNMFLVAAGDNFYGRAVTDVTLLRCSFTQEMAFCNKFAMKSLLGFTPDGDAQEDFDITLLPVHPLLWRELEITVAVMREGLLCTHYQRIKVDIIFMELRGFYKKGELVRLFKPLLSVDDDFKSRVLAIYPRVNSIKELMGELQMSPATFKRKFHNSFNIPPKQWLIQKKRGKNILGYRHD